MLYAASLPATQNPILTLILGIKYYDMEYKQKIKIYHSDTDCYNVVWHGSYVKWLEAGRVEFCEKAGIRFTELDKTGILLPVVELNIRYKNPARLFDELEVKTSLSELKKASMTFLHEVVCLNRDTLILTASATMVATNNGSFMRTLPDYIYEKLSQI